MNLPDKENLDKLILWETPEQEKEVATLIDTICDYKWRKGFDDGVMSMKMGSSPCPFRDCPKSTLSRLSYTRLMKIPALIRAREDLNHFIGHWNGSESMFSFEGSLYYEEDVLCAEGAIKKIEELQELLAELSI